MAKAQLNPNKDFGLELGRFVRAFSYLLALLVLCFFIFMVLAYMRISSCAFYTYDSTTNTYHVSVFSSDSAMTPYTESSRREGDTTVLTVGYVLPTDPWRTQETSSGTESTAPSPSKYMEYVMKTDPDTGEEYVYAVREPG